MAYEIEPLLKIRPSGPDRSSEMQARFLQKYKLFLSFYSESFTHYDMNEA